MLGLRSRPVVAGTALLMGFAALCVPFANRPVPGGAGTFVPLIVMVTALSQLATSLVLFATYRRAPRASTAILAAAFLAGGLVIVAGALTVPIGPPPFGALLTAGRQVAVWLYILWHVGFPLAAVGYARSRASFERELAPDEARRYMWMQVAFIGGTALALTFAVVTLDAHLPVLVGLHESYFRSSGIGPLVFFWEAAVTAYAMRRLPARDPIDVALILALVASTLDSGLHVVNDHRYVVAWYGARVLLLSGSTFVLIASVSSLLNWRERALALEGLLVGESRRADRHARRLSALWKVASNPVPDDERFFHALLMEAARGLDGHDFMGTLSHVEGDYAVLDVAHVADADRDLEEKFVRGMRAPVQSLMMGEVLRRNETRSWPDVHRDRRVAALPGVAGSHYRAYVGTPFRVGPVQYVLAFASRRKLPEPLSWDDHAYVETVASFCAMRLQQRSQFERLRHQSAHDAMTGLPNQTTFRNAAGDVLGAGRPFALAILDMDRFRETNEALGHQGGDLVLADVATALRGAVGTSDFVARVGGDSFGMLLRECASRQDAERRLAQLHAALGAIVRAPVSASIGVALAPQDGSSVDRLLARADHALRAAKQRGGGGWSFFDARVEDAFARARRLHSDLSLALERREFDLYFQPHVELASGRVVGAEALIRWNHPERGVLAPAEFVPFAEEQGLLSAIGWWVLRETVALSKAWRAADPAFHVWFNLSAVELGDATLIEHVRELRGQLRGIGAEITETAAMRNVHATMYTIEALRDAGLRIALDDFGTGYSSLAHLKRLPIDVVKIDQSFTAGLPSDAHDVAIVEAVIALAQHYGFETVAEGVESRHQAEFLAAAGCRYAQGFAYAQPMPVGAFESWLAERVATA